MPISEAPPLPALEEFSYLPPQAIIINRESRQRTTILTAGLKESIARNGILNPIIIRRDGTLVAGERRLASALELALPLVPVRYTDELDQRELSIVELEENLKRSDLGWRDSCKAIAALHAAYAEGNPEQTLGATALALSCSTALISMNLRVAKEIDSPKLSTITGLYSAYNLLSKFDQRKADSAFSDILEGVGDAFVETEVGVGGPVEGVGQALPQEKPQQGASPEAHPPTYGLDNGPPPAHNTAPPLRPRPAPPESILNLSFLDWAPAYSGPKFNLVHCDFPYGIGVFDGSQGSTGAASSSLMGHDGVATAAAERYDDSEEVYWKLLECLCQNLDNFMSHSAHLVFWFSLQHYEKTLKYFSLHAPSLAFHPHPLVWVRTDNRGVLADPKRRPRHIYETALVASREDRFICKATSDAYCSPSDKSDHPSGKSEVMLKYFLSMLVDESSTVLDPTCGGGSALRAAEACGAKRVLGLEINEDHALQAKAALRKFRLLRGTHGQA